MVRKSNMGMNDLNFLHALGPELSLTVIAHIFHVSIPESRKIWKSGILATDIKKKGNWVENESRNVTVKIGLFSVLKYFKVIIQITTPLLNCDGKQEWVVAGQLFQLF